MKLFLLLCTMIAASALGYFLEPSLRPLITGKPNSVVQPVDPSNPATSQPGIQIDLSKLKPEYLPKSITLKQEVKFTDTASGMVISTPAGAAATPIRIEGNNVEVTLGDTNLSVVIPINNTDLVEKVAQTLSLLASNKTANPAAPVESTTNAAAVEPAIGTDASSTAVVEPAAETESLDATAAPLATATDDVPSTATPDTSASTSETESSAVKTTIGTLNPLQASKRIETMKKSIQNQEINAFAMNQVIEWKAGPTEKKDGSSYETATAVYKIDTPFGVKTVEAKAYIKGSKVSQWIWPKTGIEIK